MSEARAYEDAANAAISYMDESELEAEEDGLQEVAVLDDASAEMLLRRIKEADEQYERMSAWYAFQLEKAKAIRDRTRAWAEGSLRAYFGMVPTHDTKTRSTYELPSGTLVLTHREPKYEQDDTKLVPWLKANWPELVKTKESSNWGELKKLLKISSDGKSMVTAEGEIVPGVTVTPQGDEFKAKVK
jgi:hypothetical protein